MESKYIAGYTSESENCPFCGCEIDTYHVDDSQTCTECDRNYFVIEENSTEISPGLPKECSKLILSIFQKYKAEEALTQSTKESIETVERWLRLIMPDEK